MEHRFRNWWNKNAPTRESLEQNRFLAPVAHRVLAPELWRFTRRSVPRGVALGMLVGIIVPIAQIAVAALLALSCRANVPVAAVTTFITNPFTTPLLWIAAYQVGRWLLHVDALTYGQPIATQIVGEGGGWLSWLTGAVPVTAFGLVVIAILTAAISYLVTSWLWSGWIARKWRARERDRAARAAERLPNE